MVTDPRARGGGWGVVGGGGSDSALSVGHRADDFHSVISACVYKRLGLHAAGGLGFSSLM